MPHLTPFVEGFRNGRIVDAGKAVEQRQPRSGIEPQHRFILRMNHRQVRRQSA